MRRDRDARHGWRGCFKRTSSCTATLFYCGITSPEGRGWWGGQPGNRLRQVGGLKRPRLVAPTNYMEHRPFAQKIRALAPDLWERFVLAVERERIQGELLRERERPKKDRAAYFRARYRARRAAGMCKLCDNPSGVFVLCIFHRARASRVRTRRAA